MIAVEFKVSTKAARWWVAIEDGDYDFQKPATAARFELQEGQPYLVVYYVVGNDGDAFLLTRTDATGKDIALADRVLGQSGLAYGQQEFTP
jgi:hypothetical protein